MLPLLLLAALQDSTVHLQVGDTVRTYELHIPAHTSDHPLAGIVLAFHGAGGTARGFRGGTRFNTQADRHRWAVAWADAPLGNWAEDCRCNNADRLGVNDTGFVRGMVRELRQMEGLADVPVYVIGFSQGGLFAHRVACQMADLVSAVAVVAGPMSRPLSERCSPSRPVSMLIVLGMQDGIFGWHGSGRGALSVLGGEETYRTWSRLNGCSDVSRREAPDGWPDASNFQWWRAAGCANSVQVVLIGADRAGHGWQLAERVDTGEIVAEFFNRVEGSRSREDKE